MRELKFRAWDKREGKMWVPIIDTDGAPCAKNPISCHMVRMTGELLDPIMQYTGLTDANGKDIFEGDVLKHNPDDDDWNDSVVWWDEKARFELSSFVNFPLEAMAKKYESEDDLFTQYGLDSMERAAGNRDSTMLVLAEIVSGADNPSVIIGNIYENPDLCGEI